MINAVLNITCGVPLGSILGPFSFCGYKTVNFFFLGLISFYVTIPQPQFQKKVI